MKKIIFCLFLISGVVVASDFSIEPLFPSEEALRTDKSTIPMQIEELPFGFKIVVRDNDNTSNDIDEPNKAEKKQHHFNHQKMPPKYEKRDLRMPPPPPCHHSAENTDCFQLGHRISRDDVSFNNRCDIEKRTDSMMKLMKNHHKGEEILGILHKQTRLLERIMILLEKLLEKRTNYHKKHYEFPFLYDD